MVRESDKIFLDLDGMFHLKFPHRLYYIHILTVVNTLKRVIIWFQIENVTSN